MLIEQAVFARATGGHTNHYELTGQSSDVNSSDAAALSTWGPAHDCLLEQRCGASSINFFPLPSGAYCVSRSQPQSSGMWQDDVDVLTHALIVDAASFAEVHHDPFAVAAAMDVAGLWLLSPPTDEKLSAIQLHIESSIVAHERIALAVSTFGLSWLVGAIDVLLNHSAVAIVGDASREQLVSALVTCLPPSCRSELSFSTGLKYSPRRPFRLFAVGVDPAEQRRVSRQGDVVMLDLRDEPPLPANSMAGWSGWIQDIMTRGDSVALSRRLGEMPCGVHLARLNSWGDLLLERIDDNRRSATGSEGNSSNWSEDSGRGKRITRQDGPKLKPGNGGISLVEETASDPSVVLGRDCPGAVEMLETLDDALFEAICGKPGAMDEVKSLWNDVLRRLGPALVEEARAQYVRHVMHLWRHCVDGDEIRNPALSVTVTEVMEMMLGGR